MKYSDILLDQRLNGEDYPIANDIIRKVIDVYDDIMWDIRYRYREIKYWLLYRTVSRYKDGHWRVTPKTLNIGYHDQDALILHCSMQCLVDYHDKEMYIVDWTWREDFVSAKKDIEEIYQWWTIDRDIKLKEIEQLYDESNTSSYRRKEYMRVHDIEAFIDKTDNDMLHKLIDIRKFLWS